MPVRRIRSDAGAPAAAGTADTRPAPTLLEQATASGRLAFDELEGAQLDRLSEAYNPVVDALVENGIDRSSLKTPNLLTRDFARPYDYGLVWKAVERARRADPTAYPDLPKTRRDFEMARLRRSGGADRDERLLARSAGDVGDTVAQFAGAAVGGSLSPEDLAIGAGTGGLGRGLSLARQVVIQGAAGAAGEAAMTRQRVEGGANVGREIGAAEIAYNIGGAAAFGGALPVASRVVAKIGEAGYEALAPVRERIDAKLGDRNMARAFARSVPEFERTDEQAAALHVLQRGADVDDANPFQNTYEGLDTHRERLTAAMEALEEGRVAREAAPAPAVATQPDIPVRGEAEPAQRAPAASAGNRGGYDLQAVKAAIRGPESGGDDGVTNRAGSSAAGRYQFISSTFKAYHRKVYGSSKAQAARAWQTQRFDSQVQERLMDALVEDNANALRRAGIEPTTGDLYVAHFAGSGTAVKLIKADPNTPVARFFSREAISQNGSYLGGGKTVGQALAIIRGKVGDGAGSSRRAAADAGPAFLDDGADAVSRALDAEEADIELARVRNELLQSEAQPAALAVTGSGTAGRAIPIQAFAADDIDVDAQLMQFKSGGDAAGVTERLQGVAEWDPIAAGTVTVWEGADGRRLIADGHQRLGLAKRIQDSVGGKVEVNALVLREADGFTARDARILTALKNIGEGTGSAVDAPKVLRDAGDEFEAAIKRRLPPRSALVRDGKSLARLSDEAFGAAINEVIPENYAAVIGRLADDPDTHMGLVDVLAQTDPPNARQAESIIRQALDAGFVKETQDELFGARELTTGLFAVRAKALDRALAELKKMKGAFQVAARNADALDGAGNRIDVAASEAAADGNARALALVDALALRKGNAVNDLLNEAARRLGEGEALAGVVRDLVRDVRKLDLDSVVRTAGDAGENGRAGGGGDAAGGSGRAGEPADQDGARFESDQLDPAGYDPDAPATRDKLEAAGQTGFDIFGGDDAAPVKTPDFDDPAGAGVRAVADSEWHDLRAAVDADADAAALRVDLSDGRGERGVADIDAELSRDADGIAAMRDCML